MQLRKQHKKKDLLKQKYIHPIWHFSYAPFDKIERDRREGPAKNRAFALNPRLASGGPDISLFLVRLWTYLTGWASHTDAN
jgi:hypothetical protein